MKTKVKFPVFVLLAIVTFILVGSISVDTKTSQLRQLSHYVQDFTTKVRHSKPWDNDRIYGHEFWKPIFELYDQNSVHDAHFIDLKSGMSKNFGKSKNSLLKRCEISPERLQQLQEKHANVVNGLPDQIDISTYKNGTSGIVMIGGGFYLWLSMLSVVQLRKLGSSLPIEIILPRRSDYDEKFCEVDLARYNAKCVSLSDYLDLDESKWTFRTYQYKGLALLVNSFQHVFLLDSDNFPVANVDSYFDSEVYKDNNMVLWPDYWKRSISPLYYDIAQVPVNDAKQVRKNAIPLIEPVYLTDEQAAKALFHDLEGTMADFSTESGQIMVNKQTHGKALLLALYYNIMGPDVFYKLFSLGARGEGDKDTFPAAAIVTNASYYQVKSYISPFSMELENGEKKNSAMGQHDPVIDYQIFKSGFELLQSDPDNQGLSLEQQVSVVDDFYETLFSKTSGQVPIFSVHCNIWKINPPKYLNNNDIYNRDTNCIKKRMYNGFKYPLGDEEVDFELERWKIAHQLACIDKIEFTNFANQDLDRVCQFMSNSIEWLKSN